MLKALYSSLGALLLSLFLCQTPLSAQKQGWHYVPMPELAYSTDLGWTLGTYCDFFDYGDGSDYPNFRHHIDVTAAWASKGSHFIHLPGESKTLIPGFRVSGSMTYRKATASSFYGFNGIRSPYHRDWDPDLTTGLAYYNLDRELLRAHFNIQGSILRDQPLRWTGGLLFRKINMAPHSLEDYKSGSVASLYADYLNAGLIRDGEAGGGLSLTAQLGLVWDSRDVEWVPSRGMYAEAYLNACGDLAENGSNYAQAVLHFRHFIPAIPGRLTVAYHIGFQQQIAGKMPWYHLNEISTLYYAHEEFEGIGSRDTMRGVLYNRFAAAGYLWGNFELRTRVFSVTLFGQDFDGILSPFLDLTGITKYFRSEEQAGFAGLLYQDDRSKRLFASAGCGAKLHMNTNFILSLDVGRAFDPEVACTTISMGTIYMF